MDKQNETHTYNGILFSRKKEILTRATTWTTLEDIMLSEIRQSRKTTITCHSCEVPRSQGHGDRK